MCHTPIQSAPVSPNTEEIYWRVPWTCCGLGPEAARQLLYYRNWGLPACWQFDSCILSAEPPLRQDITASSHKNFCKSHKTGKNNSTTHLRLVLDKWKNWKRFLQAEQLSKHNFGNIQGLTAQFITSSIQNLPWSKTVSVCTLYFKPKTYTHTARYCTVAKEAILVCWLSGTSGWKCHLLNKHASMAC